MVIKVARNGLVGSADNSIGLPLRQSTGFLVHQGTGFLDEAIGVVDRLRHAVIADGEMLQRASCLGAVVFVGRNLDRSHGVELAAGSGRRQADRHVLHDRVIACCLVHNGLPERLHRVIIGERHPPPFQHPYPIRPPARWLKARATTRARHHSRLRP